MSEPFDQESYQSLLEQGLDLQRRHDAVLESKTWRTQLEVGRALRSPSRLLRLPARLWRILWSSPVAPLTPRLELPDVPEPLPAGKPLVLALLPWLHVGGAERVVLEIIRGLGKEISFAILPASGAGPGDPELLASTPWIFPPPRAEYARRVSDIVRNNAVRCVLISSCPQAYDALPALRRTSTVRVVDILHNAAAEGSLAASATQDRFLDLHFAVGDHQADALRRAGVAPTKIAIARNGVDCDGRYRPRAEPRPPGGPLLIAWVGRLSEEKDPFLFIRTLAKLPAARGLLIGDGPERFHVERLICELGVADRVQITGFTSCVAERLATCDVLALTSRTEGSPLTVLEAMSLEKPVVATDVGGVGEAIQDGVTGMLVRDRTPEAFASVLRRLGENPDLRRELGLNGRLRVLDRFSRDGMLEAYRSGLQTLGIVG